MNANITTQLQPKSTLAYTGDDKWLTLEQEGVSGRINTDDIYQMWLLAKSGISARTFSPRDCDVKFNSEEIIFRIYFYVFPSEEGLPYDLDATLGDVSGGIVQESNREFGVFFDSSQQVTLSKVYEDVEFDYRSPCFNEYGEEIDIPEINVDKKSMYVDEQPIFLVAKATGVEKGFKHYVETTLPLYNDDGEKLKYEDIHCTITATWMNNGVVENEQLELEIPDCVAFALAMCKGQPNLICYDCDGLYYYIYFSTCTGKVVSVVPTDIYEDQDFWCLPL